MLVWSNFHFRVLNHWLNVLVARINLYQDLYPMLSVQLMRLWEMQIGCLQKMRRKKERYQLLLWKLIFLLYVYLWAAGIWLELYQGVSIGGGIGSISDILDASQMIIENVCILTPAFIFSGCKFYFSSYSYVMVMSMWWWLVEQSPLSMLCLYVDLKIVVCILLWLKNGLNASVT